MEDLQSNNEALELVRLADSVDGEVEIDFGTGSEEASQLPVTEEDELMEEEEAGPAKRIKRPYSREQLDALEQERFGGIMKNAHIAATISRLNGAREVTIQDVRL